MSLSSVSQLGIGKMNIYCGCFVKLFAIKLMVKGIVKFFSVLGIVSMTAFCQSPTNKIPLKETTLPQHYSYIDEC